MSKTSRIGLLWDSVSDNMGDQAIGLVLQRALIANGLPIEVVNPFTAIHENLAMLVIGGGELIRTPGDPFYDAFRVPGKHVLNTVGVLDGTATEYLADYRLVTSRSQSDQARLSRGEVYPDLTLLFGDYVHSTSLDIDIPKGALGMHIMPSQPEEILSIANWLRKVDLGPIVWLPMTHYANDEALMRVLAENVSGSVLLPKLPAEAVFKVISRLRLLVTSSLHGSLFAYAQDVPFLSLQRYSKLAHFLVDRRLNRHLVTTPADLQKVLPRWLHRPPSMNTSRRRDQARCRELVELICAHADDALRRSDSAPIISLPQTNLRLYQDRMYFGNAEGRYIADWISHRITLQSRDERIQELVDSIDRDQKKTADMQAEIIARGNALDQKNAAIQDYKKQIADMDAEIATRGNTLRQQQAAIHHYQLTLQSRDERIQELVDSIDRDQKKTADMQAEIIARGNALDQKNAAIQDYKKQIADMDAEIATRGNTLRQQQAAIHHYQQELLSARTKPSRVRFIWQSFGPVIGIFRKRESASSAPPGLVFAVDTDLRKPVYVGQGVAFPLQGWCYSQRALIRNLEVLANGIPHRAAAHSRARIDVFNNQCPAFDKSGNSLLSGYYAVLPFNAIDRQEQVQLGLRAVLEDDSVVEQSIGTLDLLPGSEERPVPAKWGAGEGRIAICMTAYNPLPDLFRKQIESIQKQTYSNWVCIISDDASSAAARRDMRSIIKGNDRFTLVENEIRLGFYRNFERCLRFAPADADFIALSDQDDVWYQDKLEALLTEFRNDTQLVYSDMQLIDRVDQVLSDSFWIHRRNNYSNLPTLLFANTITGAASMFRASLLPILLPFPERVIDAYHDHWLGLTALVKGKIRFVNRPLYAYRQHDANVIGHRKEQPYPGLLQGLKAIAGAARDRVQLQTMGRTILADAVQAYPYIIHKIVLAKTLRLRQADTARSKKKFLNRIVRLEHSLLPLITENLRATISRRPTLGLERYHLRIALGVRLWDKYFRNQKARLLYTQVQRAEAASFSIPPALSSPQTPRNGLPIMQAVRFGSTQWISHNISPLTLDISNQYPRRVNLLMATIDFRYVYGGYIGMFSLTLKLKKAGYKTRIILMEKTDYDIEAWRHQAHKYPGLKHLFDEVDILYRYDRSLEVKTNPNDAFVATSCWTAHIAHEATRQLTRKRFTFLVQDYEPVFTPMNSIHAIFMQAYTFPQYDLFSTELLREYFCMNHLGVYADSEEEGNALSVSFQNAINRFSIKPETICRNRKKLLFYARPEPHAARNMFELGMMSLVKLLNSGEFDINRWTFHGIGSIDLKLQLELAPNVHLKLMPRADLQEYIELLPTFDVGMSLMLTPHPSLVPLEMASAGLLTVTNSFANKTAEKLRAISSNLIAVPPTIDGLKEGLLEAVRHVDDYDRRLAGTQVHWATDWEDAFNAQVMEKLQCFLD